MRNDKIVEYHEELFKCLTRYHRKHKDFIFSMRENNNGGKFEKGWLFRGSDCYIIFTCWTGSTGKDQFYKISFAYNYREEVAFISIRPKRRKKLEYAYLYKLANILKKSKAVRKGYWGDKCIGVDRYNLCYKADGFINNVEHFLNHEKKIIDKYIKENRFDGIGFLDKKDFRTSLRRIKLYKQLNEIKRKIRELP